mmetsp:Transcript_28386/g.59169  ORF Transcript_28386/g.59169 Transcript_28386/m.59169 type:complete len:86 (-) Transcript_28386:4543-4800(-)
MYKTTHCGLIGRRYHCTKHIRVMYPILVGQMSQKERTQWRPGKGQNDFSPMKIFCVLKCLCNRSKLSKSLDANKSNLELDGGKLG